ncbi:MAG: DUF3644 domain-containing protein [Candidatus Scalindua sp.]|nr:DUF3644 domain-containing protein [Candidatus Scalindua sp.]
MAKGKRNLWSVKNELLIKSREAMLCAVQIFNNPNIVFKSESFIVLANIAWTYLLHSYYKKSGINYRYYEQKAQRKRYDKTKRGSFKYWELERCLNDKNCPIDSVTISNLKFLIGLRHEIVHQMTTRIDDYLSARFQACCLNYNKYVKRLFGEDYGIDKYLSFSIQFSSITEDHAKQLKEFSELPQNIAAYINDFDNSISEEVFNNPQYSYRVLYVPRTANRKGQADKVIEFIPADSPEAQGLNKEYRIIRDREKPKHLPTEIIDIMRSKGFKKFGMHQHTQLWKQFDAKDEAKGFGVRVANAWYWYDNWIKEVEKYCVENKELYVD